MKTEDIIIEAIEKAKERGIKLTRRSIFNWCSEYRNDFNQIRYKMATSPTECCAIGSVLLHKNKEDLAGPGGFKNGWLKEVSDILGKSRIWIWKFVQGWGYGNELKFKKEDGSFVYDPVSKWANRLAISYIDKEK